MRLSALQFRGELWKSRPCFLHPEGRRDKRLTPPFHQLQADFGSRQRPTGRCTHLIH